MIGTTISHYHIVEALGSGGMGVVYKARDTRLDRLVALKLLPVDKVADAERKRRFVNEAKAASAINHPNIITIYDIDEDGGTDFMAMEYVTGHTLGRLIGRGLAAKDAVKYAIQITDALAAAHAVGIVHRDLKPANVMVTEAGLVKVLDFGLAKLTEPAAGDTGSTATAFAGTAAYMSPEQIAGRSVDGRSDIFSFGAVLYEMLAGRGAFAGLMREAPAPLVDVPAELDNIVVRCLRRDPRERFQTAAVLKGALEMIDPESSSAPSIAVLPFANLSADKENEYFSDGLAADLTDALTQVPGLRVAARTSAFAFRGKEVDVNEIGTKLKVALILEGSVRKAGNRIRVTAQLVEAGNGYHVWSQRFDREMTDVFAIQDEISQAIVEKLRVRLVPGRPLIKRHTENVAAYNLFLRGRHSLLRATPESLTKGKEYLEQAIRLDPNYALPYTGLAELHLTSAFAGFTVPKEALRKVQWAAMEALSRDEMLAEAHALLGTARASGDFDWAGAEREFRRALELNPASSLVRIQYGLFFLRPTGRLDEAVSQLQRAVELDPLGARHNAELGYLYSVTGQHGLAIAQLQRTIELDPSYFVPHWLLAITYGYIGRWDEAIAAAQRACALSGRIPTTLGVLALEYGRAGRRSEAQALLGELTAQRRAAYVLPVALIAAYVGLGELDQAVEWADKGLEERDLLVVHCLKSDPVFADLRRHPRYQALLRRMNLED